MPLQDPESAASLLDEGVLIVGAGLIGASLGMALRDAGITVWLSDRSEAALDLAVTLGAGARPTAGTTPGHVVLSVPPAHVAPQLAALQRLHPGATFSDVASVKSIPQLQAETLQVDLSSFCGAHPIAGRERSGPTAARPDLFQGMPWVLCPTAATSPRALSHAVAVATLAGAAPVRMDAARHDASLARVSHLPQIVASLLAARMVDAPEDALALAGRGLADTSRIAASAPDLWAEIVPANAAALLPLLEGLADDLAALCAALREGGPVAEATTRDLVGRGNAGHARLPGKRGRRGPAFREVPVLLDDSPGQLARVLADAAEVGVNVEDLLLEHVPGRPVGVAILAVRPEQEGQLREGLARHGWAVRDMPT